MVKKNIKNDVCTIYIIKNKINDKVYIGQTWNSIKVRLSRHFGASKSGNSCPKLYNAIRFHDKNNFYIQPIVSTKTQNDANYLEDYFINLYDSIKNGYNLKEGGYGGKHTDETKKKISEALTGRIVSAETIMKISGENNSFYGKKHTEETKIKISKFNKNKNLGKDNPFYGKKHTKETLEKISKRAKLQIGKNNPFYGKKHTDEVRRQMSINRKGKPSHMKGKHLSEEHKEKLRNKIVSEETRLKMSISAKNKNIAPEKIIENIRRMAEINKGKKRSPESIAKGAETRRKNNLTNIKRTLTTEQRKKISDGNKGKKRSNETKLKMSGKKQSPETIAKRVASFYKNKLLKQFQDFSESQLFNIQPLNDNNLKEDKTNDK